MYCSHAGCFVCTACMRADGKPKTLQEWMLDFRLKAYRRWLTMAEPEWSDNRSVAAAPYTMCIMQAHCNTCELCAW